MTGSSRRRTGPALQLVRGGETQEPAADPQTQDATEALLLAQQGYQAAVDAVDSALLPSLTDFVD